MNYWTQWRFLALCGFLCGSLASTADAAIVSVLVTIQNRAPTNSIAFAPFRVGFNNGSFDSFNINTTATAPIISIAEGGSGSAWFPAFATAQPSAVLGTVGGLLLPGATASQAFIVDSNVNQFLTFGSMVVPSNDLFIGNDSPSQFRILDAAGNLLLSQINQSARDIWDAGSEQAIPANAAFVQGGNNDARVPQNGVVTFSTSELGVFNGLITGAGYTFNSGLLSADTEIFRVSLSVQAVPEPSSMILLALPGLALAYRRFRKRSTSVNRINHCADV